MDNVPPPPPPSYPPQGPYPGYPYQMPPPQRGWFARNWAWFVPLGCLALPGLFVAGIVGVAFLVFGAIKESDPYKDGVARATSNEEVADALGTPIGKSFFVTGHINVAGSGGNADLQTSLSGPKGEGELVVVGTKSGGVWSYSVMRVHVKGTDKNIDLLEGAR